MLVRRRIVEIVIVTSLILNSGCCSLPLPKKESLEAEGLVGFNEPPAKIGYDDVESYKISPFDSLSVWIYLRYRKKDTPVVGRIVNLAVFDEHGDEVVGPVVIPHEVVIGEDGFNSKQIQLDPMGRVGVFRVRAEYSDRKSTAIMYSPPLIVQTGTDQSN